MVQQRQKAFRTREVVAWPAHCDLEEEGIQLMSQPSVFGIDVMTVKIVAD